MKKKDRKFLESNNAKMSRIALQELIAELRGNKHLVISLDEEHRMLGKQNVAVIKK